MLYALCFVWFACFGDDMMSVVQHRNHAGIASDYGVNIIQWI